MILKEITLNAKVNLGNYENQDISLTFQVPVVNSIETITKAIKASNLCKRLIKGEHFLTRPNLITTQKLGAEKVIELLRLELEEIIYDMPESKVAIKRAEIVSHYNNLTVSEKTDELF